MKPNSKLEAHRDALIAMCKTDPNVAAFIGLGSLANPSRMDAYSDLDFFLIVNEGKKTNYLSSLAWLDSLHPVHAFQNTVDGFKVLLSDDTFLEFAVFTLKELDHIPYHRPMILYAKSDKIRQQIPLKIQSVQDKDAQYYLEEALSNLLIGLLRERRGEHLAAMQMIQTYALTNLALATRTINPKVDVDPFNVTRRLEQHDPAFSDLAQKILLGPTQNIAAATILYDTLKKRLKKHPMLKAIARLL